MTDSRHNGGPPIIDLDDDHDIRMTWIKLDIAAFKRGIADLDYELRGYYITILVEMYDNRGKLPNDVALLSRRLGTTARVVRRVLAILLAQGKVYVSGDSLRNARCDEEREKLITEYCNRHRAALAREAARRESASVADAKTESLGEVSAKFAGSLAKVSTKLPRNSREFRQGLAAKNGERRAITTSDPPQLWSASDHSCGSTRARYSEGKKKEEEKIYAHSAAPNGASVSAQSDRAAPRPKPSAEQWQRFWAAYPLRKGKAAAERRFMALSPEAAEAAIVGAEHYAAEVAAKAIDPRYVKWAQGWLNERRFEDYAGADGDAPPEPVNGMAWGWWRGKEDTLRSYPIDRWQRAVTAARPNGTWPWWVLGAPPGHPECLVPEVIVEQHGYREIYQGNVRHV